MNERWEIFGSLVQLTEVRGFHGGNDDGCGPLGCDTCAFVGGYQHL